MRPSALVIIIITLFNIKGKCQTDSLWTMEGISNITVYLYQKMANDSAIGGTATVINHKNKFFLLTAHHVAKEMTLNSKVFFRIDHDRPAIVDLSSVTQGNQLNWITHPEADISLVELKPSNINIKQRLQQWSLPSALIYAGTQTLARDNDVTFFGYPILDSDIKHFSALSFSAYLASGLITNYRYDVKTKCTFFYLDQPSMQGCSGGGVYASVKKAEYYSLGKTLLLGVVHGTAGDNTGGKLCAVTPAYYVWDLLGSIN